MNSTQMKLLANRVVQLEKEVAELKRNSNVTGRNVSKPAHEYEFEDDFVEIHEADGHFDMFRIKAELLAMLNQSSNNYLELTFENYPNAARHKVYQNHLMQETKMTDADRKKLAKTRYAIAEEVSIGDDFECPGCGTKTEKKWYQQRYCNHKNPGQSTCKDFINNWFNVKRFNRTMEWLES